MARCLSWHPFIVVRVCCRKETASVAWPGVGTRPHTSQLPRLAIHNRRANDNERCLTYLASRVTSSRLALIELPCHSCSSSAPRPSSFRASEARLHCFSILTTCRLNTERRNYLDTAALSFLGKPSRLSCDHCPFHAWCLLFHSSSSSLLHSITKHWPHINSLRHFQFPFILLDSFPLLSNFAVISATPHSNISGYSTTFVPLLGKGASFPQVPLNPPPLVLAVVHSPYLWLLLFSSLLFLISIRCQQWLYVLALS